MPSGASFMINRALQPLVGLPLSIVRQAADMRVFHFGEVRRHHWGKGTVGVYALHVQCPWRIVGPGRLLTGSSDRFVAPPGESGVDQKDVRAGNLQEMRLAELLEGYDDATKSHVNATAGLVVTSVTADRYCSLDIMFSGGIHLQLFPDGSAEEDWRFFATEDDSPHLVIEGGKSSPDKR